MKRISVLRSISFFGAGMIALVSYMSCAGEPATVSSPQLVRYGAGSVDDSPAPNKAATTMGTQKIRNDEILAQITMLEGDLRQSIAEFRYADAVSSLDAIADLAKGVPAGQGRLDADRSLLNGALDALRFEPISSPSETMAGVAFKKPFAIRVSVLNGDVKTPVSGFECLVSSPSGSQVIESGPDGVVTFVPSVPDRAGKNALVFSSSLAPKDAELRDSIALRSEKGFLSLSFPHVVSTKNRRIATTISLLDFDKNGTAITNMNFSSTTLLKPLIQRGFSRIGMADFPNQLASGDEAALLKAAKAQFGAGVQRFIYGTVRIENLVQGDDGAWSCEAVGKITVRDLATGDLIYETTERIPGVGKTEAAAITDARKTLSGETFVDDLFYNM